MEVAHLGYLINRCVIRLHYTVILYYGYCYIICLRWIPKAYVTCMLQCYIFKVETEEFVKVTGNYVRCEIGYIQATVQYENAVTTDHRPV